MTWFYRFVRGCFAVWFRLTGVHFYGQENIPQQGAVVLMANHNHSKDAALFAVACPQRQVHFVAKMELYKHPLKKWFFSKLDTISLNRAEVDLSTMHQVLSYMKMQQVLGIFPEGELNNGVDLDSFKQGAVLIAFKGRAPIVPMAIQHPENWLKFWRERPYVVIGEPLVLPQVKVTHELLAEYTEICYQRICELRKVENLKK